MYNMFYISYILSNNTYLNVTMFNANISSIQFIKMLQMNKI